jgi:hypothetical protein
MFCIIILVTAINLFHETYADTSQPWLILIWYVFLIHRVSGTEIKNSLWTSLVRFRVLTAASMKMAVFWVVALCSLVEVYKRFRFQKCLLPPSLGRSPWWWRQQASLKRRYASTRLHGTTQKTAIFMDLLVWTLSIVLIKIFDVSEVRCHLKGRCNVG